MYIHFQLASTGARSTELPRKVRLLGIDTCPSLNGIMEIR